jgi:hypothetical protein
MASSKLRSARNRQLGPTSMGALQIGSVISVASCSPISDFLRTNRHPAPISQPSRQPRQKRNPSHPKTFRHAMSPRSPRLSAHRPLANVFAQAPISPPSAHRAHHGSVLPTAYRLPPTMPPDHGRCMTFCAPVRKKHPSANKSAPLFTSAKNATPAVPRLFATAGRQEPPEFLRTDP